MTLRIAWACYPQNANLAIAANIFVYVGTMILYLLNWFFVQRIVRAQHTRLGWSTPYRIFHRAALGCLIIALLMIIISQVWRSFTQNETKLTTFRALFLTGQTYFTVFCLAPAILVAISLIIPRTEVEKFGAGRLRINITIMLIAVAILSTGQVFRCVLAWIPATPLVALQRGRIAMPWYLTKPCFYMFNFVTELSVVIMFAIVRVDLRFYVPNGSAKPGDYSSSRVNLDPLDNEKPSVAPPSPMIHENNSNQTIHCYESSIFEDTQTLADSLRYPSSTLEVDQKTGNWKIKRLSGDTSSTHTSMSFASTSKSTLNDRSTLVDQNAPPVPEIPAEWPLADNARPRGASAVLEHSNPVSRRGTSHMRRYAIDSYQLNNQDIGTGVTEALGRLEMNSESNKRKSQTPSPHFSRHSSVHVYNPTLPPNGERSSTRRSRKRATYPPNDSLRIRTRASSASSDATKTPIISEAPEIPQKTTVLTSRAMRRSSPNLEVIALEQHTSDASNRVVDATLLRAEVSSIGDTSQAQSEAPASRAVTRLSSAKYSNGTTSSYAMEAVAAEDEFSKFDYEAPSRTQNVSR